MKSFSRKHIFFYLAVFSLFFAFTPQTLPEISDISAVSAETTSDIRLSRKKLTLKQGSKKKLKLKHASGKIKWKSSNKKIATVSKKGVVKAKKAGKSTITAVYDGQKYKCKVTVKAKKSSSDSKSSRSSSSSSGNSDTSGSKNTVYWTPGGSVYHSTDDCPTLARSSVIYKGTISQSGKSRACKVCH